MLFVNCFAVLELVIKKLALYAVEKIDQLAWPENYSDFSIKSPALTIFTDFTQVEPVVIEQSTSAVDVEYLMKKAHVRLKLVIDEAEQFIGLVTSDLLNHQEIMKKVSQGFVREQLSVIDFMVEKSALKAIDYGDLCHARIGDVVDTLHDAGEQHCLVVDHENHSIRGVLSANDIAKRLKLAVDVSTSTSFSVIFKAIYQPKQSVIPLSA
ncbi:CBS domain-containing protein [Shewanella sp.]|uniref:CBS domain-containing protein n=1 Tax=Shewanella sp. TaxID=50422 RepID=UPI004053A831